jgi:hypothetical protein
MLVDSVKIDIEQRGNCGGWIITSVMQYCNGGCSERHLIKDKLESRDVAITCAIAHVMENTGWDCEGELRRQINDHYSSGELSMTFTVISNFKGMEWKVNTVPFDAVNKEVDLTKLIEL